MPHAVYTFIASRFCVMCRGTPGVPVMTDPPSQVDKEVQTDNAQHYAATEPITSELQFSLTAEGLMIPNSQPKSFIYLQSLTVIDLV